MFAKSRRERPTWAILHNLSTPASEVHKLLGSIVADVENPAHEHVPEDASAILATTSAPLEVADENVNTVLSGSLEGSVRARLQFIFNTEVTKTTSVGTAIGAKTVITRTIKQHRAIFAAIIKAHKHEVMKLLEDNLTGKGRGYMVVGIRTCIDADIETSTGLHQLIEGGFQVPVNEAITASTGSASIIAGPSNNPEISATRKQVTETLTHSIALGERIFSIQYRQIWRKRERLMSRSVHAEYGRLLAVDSRMGMFSGSSEEDDSSCDDEEDDNDTDPAGLRTIELGSVLEESPGSLLFTRFC